MSGWKLASSDAPSRVDTLETIGSMSYNAQWVDSVNTQFNSSTVFVWSPDLGEGQLAVFNSADATTAASALTSVARTVTTSTEYFVKGTTPSLAAIAATPNRCCALSGSCILALDWGVNTGLLRMMRITDLLESLDIGTIAGLLGSEIQGVKEYILGGKQNICLRASMHQKAALGNMTAVRSTFFNMGTDTPLSGWVFRFTTIGAASAIPAPVLRVHAGLRVQRELTYPEAYLHDSLRTIPVATLSGSSRSSADPTLKPPAGEIRDQMLSSVNELGSKDDGKKGHSQLRGKLSPAEKDAMQKSHKESYAETTRKVKKAANTVSKVVDAYGRTIDMIQGVPYRQGITYNPHGADPWFGPLPGIGLGNVPVQGALGNGRRLKKKAVSKRW